MPEKRAEETLNSGTARKRIKLRDLDSICDSKSSAQQNLGLLATKPNTASYSSRENQNGFSQDLESIVCRASGDPIESAHLITDVLPDSLEEEGGTPSVTPGRNALSLLGAAACLSLRQDEKPLLPESSLSVLSVSSESAPKYFIYESESTKASAGNVEQCFRYPQLTSVDLTLRPPNICHEDMADNIDKLNVSCQQEVSVRNQDQKGCVRMWNNGKRKKAVDLDQKASECGSSVVPPDETDSLRIWKAMKQNGFVSSQFHAPMHKRLHTSKPPLSKKVKSDLLKKNLEIAKREQVNRFKKIAAPSGLLTGLNPGIINHVRNSKQVQSIIESLVKSEKLDNSQNQNNSANRIKAGTKATIEKEKDGRPEVTLGPDGDSASVSGSSSASHGFEYAHEKLFPTVQGTGTGDGYSNISLSEHKDFELEKLGKTSCVDALVNTQLKYEDPKNLLSRMLPPMRLPLDALSCVSTEAISAHHGNLMGLSVKAALVAHRWLELLSQDIKGRLTALKRSKKRVQTAVHYELPFIMSKEFSPDQENRQHNGRSSCTDGANHGLPDNHLEKWRSLFDQMESALQDEANQLECWLKQVKEMQLHCEHGLHGINKKGVGDAPEHAPRFTKEETKEGEHAVRAAAASIFSTCNYAMSTENVSCF